MHPLITEEGLIRRKEKYLKEAVQRGATHVVVLFDSFEMESIPQFIMPGDDVNEFCSRVKSAGAHSLGEIFTVTA